MYNRLTLQLLAAIAAFFVLPLFRASAHDQAENSIQILVTYDYPDATGYINSSGINDRGDVAGYFLQPSGHFRGFVRFADGSFSPPIVAPNDTMGITYATDINGAPTVCGESYDSRNDAYHGFLVTDRVFTLFDIEGSGSTTVAGINASGHFVGDFGPDASTGQGYIDVDGVISTFSIPEATSTIATAINGFDMVVGNYTLASDIYVHGFFRGAAGELTYPIDFPGSIQTGMRGINNHRVAVGTYTDSNFVTHGFIFKPPATFLSFTYPGASYTTLGGINDRGLICGDYRDSVSIRHGFIGRIR
jgi:hypothetical protein